MKNLILVMVLGCMLNLVFVNSSNAQVNLPELRITSPADVPDKVASAFEKSFADAQTPKWFHPNKNYVVTFIMDDIKHNALFTKNGYLLYHISYGNENTIPEEFRAMISSKFQNYDIIAVINVKQDSKSVWFITGEGKKDFLNLKIEDGVISEETRSHKFYMRS
jgi:hypothetical protein